MTALTTPVPMASDANAAHDSAIDKPVEQASASDETTAGPFATVPKLGHGA